MSHRDKFPVDKHIDEREWLAQERAANEARAAADRGDAVAAADPIAVARYRHLARALRVPPGPGLPATFAADVARLAAARPAPQRAGFEPVLLRALLLAMALSSAVVVAVYGVQWWRASAQLLGIDALGWTLAAAACAAMSWSFEWLRRRRGDEADAAPA